MALKPTAASCGASALAAASRGAHAPGGRPRATGASPSPRFFAGGVGFRFAPAVFRSVSARGFVFLVFSRRRTYGMLCRPSFYLSWLISLISLTYIHFHYI